MAHRHRRGGKSEQNLYTAVFTRGTRLHQLLADGLLERVAGAADQQRRVQAKRPQHRDAVLCRLRLLLAHGAQHRHKADVHDAEVAGPHPELELPQRLRR